MKLLTLVSFACVVASVQAIEPLPDAENVCNRTENVKKERLVRKPVEYKITVDSMCGFLSCKKTITETRINTTRETHYVEVLRRECCEGYAITPDQLCAPICLKPCQFGKCTGPNHCECNPAPSTNQPGYAGPHCNRFVCSATNRWGPNCDKVCSECSETAFCDARTGKCVCRPGWQGANCTEECDLRSGICDDLPYPIAISEPEVNIIKTDDNNTGRMSAALTLESSPLERSTEADSEDKKAFSRMLMAHLQVNLFLVILASGLIFALFCYKKKLNQLKNELYYAAYPGSSNPRGSDSASSGGYASVYNANNSTISSRARMPLPSEPSYLSKNLNFDAATRSAITGDNKIQHLDEQHLCIPISSKTERHLIMSKEPSQNNIYSDIESNLESSCVGLPVAKNHLGIQSENEYQVPRSPARPLDETNSHSNLYEELVPNSPAKADDKQ